MARRHVHMSRFLCVVGHRFNVVLSVCPHAPPMNSRNQWQPTFSFSFSFFQQRRILTRQPGNLLSVETDRHPFIFIFICWVPPCTAVITFTVWPTISRSRPQLQKEKEVLTVESSLLNALLDPQDLLSFFFFSNPRIVRFLF
jgi:hypothetical protein